MISRHSDMPRLRLAPTGGKPTALRFACRTLAAMGVASGLVQAHPQPEADQAQDSATLLETVAVEGRASDLLGLADSASQGVVGQAEFQYRPLSRVGELVEVIPGALATQHSGSGKANQYFLRGFNLDHGTDFSVMVDGVPMNMPSHAHGQGYLDLNSVIPELLDNVEYGKGPYYAEVGDFSSAGYARMHTLHRLPQGLLKLTSGEYGYNRAVAANSNSLGPGELLYAGEMHYYDGVWQRPEDLEKFNGMLRYTIDDDNWGVSVNGKAYHSTWNATNQIPQRAVDAGLIGLYGTMDPSDGGNSNRYSLSSNLWSRGENYKNDANLYAVYSDLNLFSNFTGYIDPLRGDQIDQRERRVVAGGSGEHTRFGSLLGFETDHTFGVQLRHDEVMGVALNLSQNRQAYATVRQDNIGETNVGVYYKNQTHWLPKFRSIAGLRGDFFDFNVASQALAANSGSKSAALASPKLSLIFGPWYDSEFFLNLGYGYHSNDARGTTIRIDPASDDPANTVTPLVKSRGAEIGLRNQSLPGLNSTLALWWMQMDSELVFVGDGGTTEPTGKTERYGVEWSNFYKPAACLTLDVDLAFTSAFYTGVPENADNVPNSVGRVITAGAVVDLPYGWFATARLRHFGQVPLNESGSADAGDTTILNLGAGYQQKNFKLELDVFNLLGSTANDIAYYYAARLPGETAGGLDGLLKHPIEPRMIRGTLTWRF